MIDLTPLETLYEMDLGSDLPLAPELAALYGRLQFPLHAGRPYLIANFVTTLDGVISLGIPGKADGGPISGFNQHDRMVMGLLRAVSDAVIVGAGTLRDSPQHLWTAEHVYPPLADAYQQLRTRLGKPEPPLNVIVTARGEIDLGQRVFQSGLVPVLIVTTTNGLQRIGEDNLPPTVQVTAVQPAGPLSAHEILDTVARVRPCDLILVEAGPRLTGDFFAEHVLDELFLTLAPQVAGRDSSIERPGLVAGKIFAPDHPIWGRLVGVKRGGSHLFLRYTFERSR